MASDTKLQDTTTKDNVKTTETTKNANVSDTSAKKNADKTVAETSAKDVVKKDNVAQDNKKPSFPALLATDKIKARFAEMLEKKAPSFISALLTLWRNNPKLQQCDPNSILGAAGLAATLGLSVAPSLGQAYIIPYKNQATFQIGVKGLVQLAHNTGQYTALNSNVVYEGEILGVDCVTGDIIKGTRKSDKIVGYVAFMRLVNGFEKAIYMPKDEVKKHAEKYSQSYAYDLKNGQKTSGWSTNFDVMAKKTVMKSLLTHWGVLSAELDDAISGDQSIVTKTDFQYPDNYNEKVARNNIAYDDNNAEIVDIDTGEILGDVQ